MYQPKDIDWADENMYMYVLQLTTSLCLAPPPKLYVIILYCLVNYVPIMACNCVWLLIVKTNKHLYCCDYVTIIHLIPLYHDWSTEDSRILYHQSYHLIEKSIITF